jgi:hypothetical protein
LTHKIKRDDNQQKMFVTLPQQLNLVPKMKFTIHGDNLKVMVKNEFGFMHDCEMKK